MEWQNEKLAFNNISAWHFKELETLNVSQVKQMMANNNAIKVNVVLV